MGTMQGAEAVIKCLGGDCTSKGREVMLHLKDLAVISPVTDLVITILFV
jgi:hypothetical protein